jgi:hypothetical protein
MAQLLHIPSHLEVFVTEMTVGENKSPPGDGWSVAAVVEGPKITCFVWTRSRLVAELEAEKKTGSEPKKGKKT